MIEITPRKLFGIGIFCFSITALTNIANFIIYYQTANIFSKINTIASLIFNLALVASFVYLRKITPVQNTEFKADPKEIEEALNEFSNKKRMKGGLK